MKISRIAALALAALAVSTMALAQSQPIPGAKQANGQPAPVTGSAIVIAPAGGGAGLGRVVSEDGGLPVNCVSGCSGGGGGGGAVTVADGADVAEGARLDAAAPNGTGTYSLVSLNKGILNAAIDPTPVAVNVQPSPASAVAIVPLATTVVSSALVVKTSAGNGYRYALTSGANAGYVMVFDAISAPADGTVTPKICRPVAANTGIEINHSTMPDRFATGITVVFSTTGCYTKTASATAAIEASAQ